MANPTTNFGWVMPTSTDLVTDLPADFNVFGQGVDTTMADLKGGTTGQILSKATNTDMDFIWIANDQGDITGVTATSPLTGGGTSGAITVGIQDATTSVKGAVQLSDSTSTTSSVLASTPTATKSAYDLAAAAVPKSTVTTAGDVIYATGSGAVTRLGIGTAGQVLTVNGGGTAPSWATASSGGGLTLLSTTALTGASVTVSSISGAYKNLQVVIKGLYCSVNDDGVFVRFNADTGAKYQYANYRVITSTVTGGSNVAATSLVNFFATNPTTATASRMGSAVMNLYRYTDTDVVTGDWWSIAASNTDVLAAQQGQFSYDCTAAITSITIAPYTANFSGGTMYIYGVN